MVGEEGGGGVTKSNPLDAEVIDRGGAVTGNPCGIDEYLRRGGGWEEEGERRRGGGGGWVKEGERRRVRGGG
jgi:hypothetical protein